MMIEQGMIIGERYQIIKLIGDGGMARVYLANDLILKRQVAIKILRHELADDGTFIKRFEREARAVTSLSHPNIVSIYDIGNDRGNYYIVMEYIEGKTLKHLIQERGALNVTETLALMKQITNGVAHAHSHGIIHRDLKPQNILLKRDGTVKITDFGIALTNTSTSITKTNSIMGSVHYLAPEIARGDAASVQSDIYALGIIMYEMLTGKLPFRDSAPVAIVMKHMREPFPSVRDFDASIPQSVENTIILATAKSKRNRLRTARELYAALSSALNSRRMNEQRLVFTGSDRSESYSLGTAPVKEKPKAPNENVKPKRKIRMDRILALSAVVIAAIVLIVILVMALTNSAKPKTTIVPNVSSKTVDEAKIAIENSKLKVNATIKYTYSDTVAKDRVIETDPKSAEVVEEGTTISLTVSKGANFKIDYSKIIGKSVDEVKSLFDSSNVKYTIVEKFDKQPPGTVIALSLPDGTTIEDKSVEITVSKGTEKVVVPNFVGMSYSEAEKEAEKVGIILKRTEMASNYVKKGNIIYQSVNSGSSVEKGSTITLTVSSGPPTSTGNSSGGNSGNNSGNNSGGGSNSGGGNNSGSGSNPGSGNNSGNNSGNSSGNGSGN